jgi:hypothetical protein
MPTYLKIGLIKSGDDFDKALLYIDSDKIQVIESEESDIIHLEFTYEELRGIMAIMEAEQEKDHLYIRANARKN